MKMLKSVRLCAFVRFFTNLLLVTLYVGYFGQKAHKSAQTHTF